MEEVRNCLLKSEKGGVVNNLQNSQFALENDPMLKNAIQKNLLSGQIEIVKPMIWRRNGPMLTDTDQSNIELFLERYYGLTNQRKIATAVSIVANEHQYHPIRDYLLSLEWNQTPRVRYALHHFLGADVTDFNEECLQVFMLGAVERIFHPGCKFELMLCLVGGQGAGKSSFFRMLAVHDDWFTDDLKKLDEEADPHPVWDLFRSDLIPSYYHKFLKFMPARLVRFMQSLSYVLLTGRADIIRKNRANAVKGVRVLLRSAYRKILLDNAAKYATISQLESFFREAKAFLGEKRAKVTLLLLEIVPVPKYLRNDYDKCLVDEDANKPAAILEKIKK